VKHLRLHHVEAARIAAWKRAYSQSERPHIAVGRAAHAMIDSSVTTPRRERQLVRFALETIRGSLGQTETGRAGPVI
jgi:hypothetical protein